MENDQNNNDNVVSLFERKIEKIQKVQDSNFDDIIEKNKRNEERIRKERLRSNISVLKSYNIKKKN